MQLIAEAYHLMKDGLMLSHSEMASILSDWNQGELDSFLIEITANILKFKDEDGLPLVRNIYSNIESVFDIHFNSNVLCTIIK